MVTQMEKEGTLNARLAYIASVTGLCNVKACLARMKLKDIVV